MELVVGFWAAASATGKWACPDIVVLDAPSNFLLQPNMPGWLVLLREEVEAKFLFLFFFFSCCNPVL